jgi:hypothetical protein
MGGAEGMTGTACTEELGSSRGPETGPTVIDDSGVGGSGPGDAEAAVGGEAAGGGEAAVNPGGGDAGGDGGG